MIGRRLVLLSVAMVFAGGCGGGDAPSRKETFPVVGVVKIDGAAPGSEVQLTCHPAVGMDTSQPTISQSATDAEGKFSISTYVDGDGVPPGDYTLTFKWQEFNLFSREYSGADKLKNRYGDPAKSEFKFTVKPGEQLDLGVIELKTK